MSMSMGMGRVMTTMLRSCMHTNGCNDGTAWATAVLASGYGVCRCAASGSYDAIRCGWAGDGVCMCMSNGRVYVCNGVMSGVAVCAVSDVCRVRTICTVRRVRAGG